VKKDIQSVSLGGESFFGLPDLYLPVVGGIFTVRAMELKYVAYVNYSVVLVVDRNTQILSP